MPRVLIVDDDLQLVRLYRNLLSHEGYGVSAVFAGREVRAAVLEAPPDLILLDVLLPDVDGWALLQELRGLPALEHVPILVVTARGNDRDITRGFELGASDYLVKPVHLSVLLARIATQVRLREAQAALRERNDELRALSEVKGRLVGVVSHELRTPLTSIRGALDLFSRQGEELSEGRRRLVAICLRNTDRLIRLVNGVLSFARLEAGLEMAQRPVPVAEAVAFAVEEIATLSQRQAVSIRLEIPPEPLTFLGDVDRIHQVLTNLLSNAIKFSEGGAEIWVRAALRGARIRVEVEDQGPGIRPEDTPRLFQPFSQLHQGHPSAQGGTGLGLSICAEIVRRHGGEIGAQSALGEGSTFFFEIPAAPDPETA